MFQRRILINFKQLVFLEFRANYRLCGSFAEDIPQGLKPKQFLAALYSLGLR